MKIAVIGGKDYIRGFKALGISVFPVKTGEEASKVLIDVAGNDYAIVLISEDFAEDLKETLETLREQPLPAVTFIPGVHGTRDLALQRLRKNIRRAMGK